MFDFWYTKINTTQIWYDKLISIKGSRFPTHTRQIFNL